MVKAKTEIENEPVLERPVNGLEQISFQDPLMRLVQQVIGPFVRHRQDCDGEPCGCGLVQAVSELQRREILVRRYGTVDG